jgi:hypothetical protein
MKLQSRRSFIVSVVTRALVILAICLSASLAFAGPDSSSQISTTFQPAPDSASPWEVRVGIPAWLPTISGNFQVRGVSADLNLHTFDTIDSIDGLFVLSLYVRYDRWEFFGDGFYLKASDNVTLPGLLFTQADLTLKTGFVQAFVGYRVINSPKGYLSLFAGARYNYLGGDIQAFDNGDPRFPILRAALGIPTSLRVSGSKSLIDPVVGVSGKVHVWKPISFYGKFDVGGFGVNDGTSYAINAGAEFQITRCLWLQTGWIYFKNDYSSGSFSNETESSGPLFQFGLNF